MSFFLLSYRWKFRGFLFVFNIFFALTVLLGGCGTGDQPDGDFEGWGRADRAEDGRLMGTTESDKDGDGLIHHQEKHVVHHAKEIAFSVDGVKEVAAVVIDKELSVAVDVAQMKRFQLKGIRKETFDKLRRVYPRYEIHVSTDRKILSELKRLEQKDGGYGEDERRQLKKINEDMKG